MVLPDMDTPTPSASRPAEAGPAPDARPDHPDRPEAWAALAEGSWSLDPHYGWQWHPASSRDSLDGAVVPLADHGLLEFSGADAATFLQGQLTNDVQHLALDAWRRAGYCTPKGRLLASFAVARGDERFLLTLSRSLAEPMRKRLSMYVLRAKVKILDLSLARVAVGLIGGAVPAALSGLGLQPVGPMQAGNEGGLLAMGLAPITLDDGRTLERALLWLPAADLGRLSRLVQGELHWADTAAWRYTEVMAGDARILPATSEAFVPQMVNLEVTGGVDFRKGCYPGQEVVARAHYRGAVKRRMFAGRIDGSAPVPGEDIQGMGAAGQLTPVGQVVLSAPASETDSVMLFEAQLAAVDGEMQIAGRRIDRIALPYSLPTAE